jgi:hypothetical protein
VRERSGVRASVRCDTREGAAAAAAGSKMACGLGRQAMQEQNG